ncbi:hypothetical protein GGS20DRAFT_587192 [Poronia punctata]|nr:hypothetical protein GGS20DRAFT_587192 [Poronia punctata]
MSKSSKLCNLLPENEASEKSEKDSSVEECSSSQQDRRLLRGPFSRSSRGDDERETGVVKQSVYNPGGPSRVFEITLPSTTTLQRLFNMASSSVQYSSLPRQEEANDLVELSPCPTTTTTTTDETVSLDETVNLVKNCILFPQIRGKYMSEAHFSPEQKTSLLAVFDMFDDMQRRHRNNWDHERAFNIPLIHPASHDEIIEEHKTGDWVALRKSAVDAERLIAQAQAKINDPDLLFENIIAALESTLKTFSAMKDKGLKDKLQLTKQRFTLAGQTLTYLTVIVSVVLYIQSLVLKGASSTTAPPTGSGSVNFTFAEDEV